ncbi:MAG: CDP-diacylglycerol--glycerol-3-phosphate 3-phosphatidyltransferase [Deltaproteobacteria bacterium]|nr:CDP-diacylglycerol--glycerol-3-phosphate 3-phosphatidyltransferase [Deltaproteobacteria bacterium]
MKAKDEKTPLWTLPNRLSLIRILSIPLICVFISFGEEKFFLLSFFLFVVAGITDGLDGFFARRLALKSKFGVYIDPIADKMLIVSCLMTLSYYKMVPLWLTITLALREFLITGIRAFYAGEGITVYPVKSGKYKTAFQILGISLILFNRSFKKPLFPLNHYFEPGIVALILALILSIYSAVKYLSGVTKFT